MSTEKEIAAAVAGARDVLDGFFEAFNAEDQEAIKTRWFHFPHVRSHSGRVTVMDTPEDFTATIWERKERPKAGRWGIQGRSCWADKG